MKSIRRLALVSAAVAVLGLGFGPGVGDAQADHKWKHRGHQHGPKWDRDRYDDRRWDRRHDDRYRYDDRRSSYDSEKCAEVARRIDRAHYEINKWEGTGRHEGVVSWYKGDLRNAMRDRARYCSGRIAAPDWRRDRYYDRSDYDRYDPYDGYDDDRGFDIERDWPSLLGLFMNNGVQLGY